MLVFPCFDNFILLAPLSFSFLVVVSILLIIINIILYYYYVIIIFATILLFSNTLSLSLLYLINYLTLFNVFCICLWHRIVAHTWEFTLLNVVTQKTLDHARGSNI